MARHKVAVLAFEQVFKNPGKLAQYEGKAWKDILPADANVNVFKKPVFRAPRTQIRIPGITGTYAPRLRDFRACVAGKLEGKLKGKSPAEIRYQLAKAAVECKQEITTPHTEAKHRARLIAIQPVQMSGK